MEQDVHKAVKQNKSKLLPAKREDTAEEPKLIWADAAAAVM